MIRVPTHGVLNAHSLILPHYRGVFSEFWQTLEGRLDTAGVTFHFVDEGVDTGDVVLQVRTECEPGIDPYRVRGRNVAATVSAYPQAARSVLRGDGERRRQEASDAPTFRSRDRTLDKRLELLRALGHDV